MDERNTATLCGRPRAPGRVIVQIAAVIALSALVSISAIIVKHARVRTGLAALAELESNGPATVLPSALEEPASEGSWTTRIPTDAEAIFEPAALQAAPPPTNEAAEAPGSDFPPDTRWFDGRPVRPARTMLMTVTAYSPDERSCGASADGITSSLHSVWTNGMKLVAADSRVLPLGSMISIPGYDDGKVVPVLDRGGAIKGRRLDVLYATHEEARSWGVRRLRITVWEYADGKPAGNWRNTRDSK